MSGAFQWPGRRIGRGRCLAVVGLHEGALEIEDDLPAAFPALRAVVAVGDVAGGAPEVPDILGPLPGFAAAPFADAEDDGAFGGVEGIVYGGVVLLRVAGAGGAPVVLDVGDAPRH